jgi:hypothetical protein
VAYETACLGTAEKERSSEPVKMCSENYATKVLRRAGQSHEAKSGSLSLLPVFHRVRCSVLMPAYCIPYLANGPVPRYAYSDGKTEE